MPTPLRSNRPVQPAATLFTLATALGLSLSLSLGLSGCQSTGPAVPTARLAPPTALHLDGVPPVPQALAARAQPYLDSAGHQLTDWQPDAPAMLVQHRPPGTSTTQLWRLAAPGLAPERLTDSAEPVADAWCVPPSCGHTVFLRGSGGNEAWQLFVQPTRPGAVAQQLTPSDARHSLEHWLRRSPELIHTSVPLDRTAPGGRRAAPTTQLWRLDPLRPETRRQLAELPGTGWGVADSSPDDRQLLLQRYLSVTASEVWLLDTASGQRRQLLPAPGAPAAADRPVGFSADGKSIYLLSDADSEFRELVQWPLDGGARRRITADVPWDVDDAHLSADGRVLALRINADGRQVLQLRDAASGLLLPLPGGPQALPEGSVRRLRFHPTLPLLGVVLDNAHGPGQVFSLDLAGGQVRQWTRAHLHPALDVAALQPMQTVRWASFDGRRISGLLMRPPVRFTGKRPVLISIHGGPEGQAQVRFGGRDNLLANELGIAVLYPNVRGSTGYGKSFVSLDNGMRREDSVKDIGALLDWIATQPELDAQRVVVSGGSYGGYMALAVAATYPQRIAGAIDVVGISHFVTFLESTESYRRDLRRVEYGDEREPAMREFLHRISPLTNAHRITKPLFVVQGRNDPRVPMAEAEQIVARVRANPAQASGGVWYLRAENEGHGFARRENADYQFLATLLFLQQVLGLPPLR